MRLYRAVSEAEREDIVVSGIFRLNPDSFGFGKWFAFSLADAETWGCRFAGFDGLNYYVVEAEVAEDALAQFAIRQNLDNIGQVVFVEETQLVELTVIAVPQTYILCKDGTIRIKLAP